MSSLKSRFCVVIATSALVLSACATTEIAATEPVELANDDQRAAAERADPLTRARFWASEYQKEPENIESAKYFAYALREIESHDRVLEVVSNTLILYPADYDLLMLLGRTYLSQGNSQYASQAFGRAIQSDNTRADAFAALGLAYDRAEQHTYAQRAYAKALAIDPSRTGTLANYGLSQALSGDIDGAEAALRKAASQPGANSRVKQNLALVLGLQGKFDEMKLVDEGAPAEVMKQNAELLQRMIERQSPIATVSDGRPLAPAKVVPSEKIETAPTTPVASGGLMDIVAVVPAKSHPPKIQNTVSAAQTPQTGTITQSAASAPAVINTPKMQDVVSAAAKSAERKIENVEAIISTATKSPQKPAADADTQTARLPGGLRGSLPD